MHHKLQGHTKVLSADRVIEGPSHISQNHDAILVEGNSIKAVGSLDDIRETAGSQAEWHHYPGCSILPGLIDSHVHLNFSSGRFVADDTFEDSTERLVIRGIANARQALQTGVTTIRDLGSRGRTAIEIRDAIRDGIIPGPRTLVSGIPITSLKGHYWWLGGGTEGIDGVTSLARELVEEGVDVIKVMATGGNMGAKNERLLEMTDDNPIATQFAREELEAIVKIAREAGLRVSAHARGVQGIRNAVEAGIDNIEHCRMEVALGEWGFDESLAAMMAEKGTTAAPTFAASYRSFQQREAGGHVGLSKGAIPISTRQQNARRLRESGVRVVVGTDAGAGLSRFDEAVHLEMELLVEIGWTPLEAIEAGTIGSAIAIGRAEDLGSIEPNKLADFVVVQGDPSRDISMIREVEAVFFEGCLVSANGQLAADARPQPWPWPYDQLRD